MRKTLQYSTVEKDRTYDSPLSCLQAVTTTVVVSFDSFTRLPAFARLVAEFFARTVAICPLYQMMNGPPSILLVLGCFLRFTPYVVGIFCPDATPTTHRIEQCQAIVSHCSICSRSPNISCRNSCLEVYLPSLSEPSQAITLSVAIHWDTATIG